MLHRLWVNSAFVCRSRWSLGRGVRLAGHFSAVCPQEDFKPDNFYYREYFHSSPEKSEDCLYLNIWTPAKSDDENLPVFFYIHGGGLMYGYGAEIPLDGENLCKSGMVVVTINYRLNIFGFFSHPELCAESEYGVSGNYAFFDQIEAIKWVRKNIRGFGGNPDCITIAGQSGGGRSVSLHLVSPLTKGLFHRAIPQSGSAIGGLGMDTRLAEAEKSGIALMESMNLRSIKELRKIPGVEFFEKYSKHFLWKVGPVIDGYFLPDEPSAIIMRGEQNKIPLLTGSATHEGIIDLEDLTPELYNANMKQKYGNLYEKYRRYYSGEIKEQAVFSCNASRSDHYFVGHREFAYIHSKTSGNDSYQYIFAKVPPGRESDKYGAFHTGELAYIFKNLSDIDRSWKNDDYRYSDIISQYWVNFARSGNPNGSGLPQWNSCTDFNDHVMLLLN